MTDQYPDPESPEGLRYMFNALDQAAKEPAYRVGGIYGFEWDSPYPDRPPGVTLHLSWLEPRDDNPQAPPLVIALDLHIPSEMIPDLSRVLAGIRNSGPRKAAGTPRRKRPRKR